METVSDQNQAQMQRNLRLRRATIGVTLSQMAEAGGVTRQWYSALCKTKRNTSLATLRKQAMLFWCPPQVLMGDSVEAVVSYPLPPEGYLEVIAKHREELGLVGRTPVPSWPQFEEFVLSKLANP